MQLSTSIFALQVFIAFPLFFLPSYAATANIFNPPLGCQPLPTVKIPPHVRGLDPSINARGNGICYWPEDETPIKDGDWTEPMLLAAGTWSLNWSMNQEIAGSELSLFRSIHHFLSNLYNAIVAFAVSIVTATGEQMQTVIHDNGGLFTSNGNDPVIFNALFFYAHENPGLCAEIWVKAVS